MAALRARGVTPHVAQNDRGRRSAVDGRTTRHRGYRQSQQRRKIVEQVFGWMKTVGGGRKLRFVGRERNRGWLELTAAAYNLVRMARLETRRGVGAVRPPPRPGSPQRPPGSGQEATITNPEAASSRLSPLRDPGRRFFSTLLTPVRSPRTARSRRQSRR